MSESNPELPGPRGRTWRVFKALTFAALLFTLLLAIGAASGAYLVYRHVTEPGVGGEEIGVTVPEGATGRDVARLLDEAGLLEHEWFFLLAIRFDESGNTIKHGAYRLARGLSSSQLLRIVQDGPRVLEPEAPHKLTLPEGLTVAQMAQLFDDEAAFIEAASNPALIEGFGIEAATLEGFLMPNTYFFSEKPEPAEVVQRMVAQFEAVYATLIEAQPEAAEYDPFEIVTIASLIEEEARVDEERPLIAAVIRNRLKRRMPLEMDATLQYALGKYGKRLLNEDKETDSPYNTYKYRDLPPGPISNPGVASLRAAMAPADAPYLYFVSNADGKTHTFSSTLRDHNRAVARYRREAAKQRRKQRAEQRAAEAAAEEGRVE